MAGKTKEVKIRVSVDNKTEPAIKTVNQSISELSTATISLSKEIKKALDDALSGGADKSKRKVKQLKTGVNEVESFIKKLGLESRKVFSSISNGAGKVFKTLTSFPALLGGLAAGSAAKNVLETFTSFDDAARGATAVMGATEEVFLKVSAAARQAGRDTKFTAVQTSQGIEQLGRAFGDADKAIGSLRKTLQLASAGNIDVAEGVRITTGVMAAYKLEMKHLAQVVDVLGVADTTTKATIAGIGESMTYVGGTARSMGVDFEELISVLALLAESNLDASMAGTSLNQAFIALLKPTGESVKMLEKLQGRLDGVKLKVKAADGSFIGFIPILKQLREAGIDAKEAMELFDVQGGRAMQALILQGWEKLEKQLNKSRNAIGTIKKISDFKESGLGGVFRRLRSAIAELEIAFADAFNEELKGVVDDLRGYVLDLITRLKELKEDGSLKDWADEAIVTLEKLKDAAVAIASAINSIAGAVKFLYEGHSKEILAKLDAEKLQKEGDKTGIYRFKINRADVIRSIRMQKEWEAKKKAEEEEKALQKTQKAIGKAGFKAPVKPKVVKKTEKQIRQELALQVAKDIDSVMRSLADLSVADVQKELMYEAGKTSMEEYFAGRKASLIERFEAEKNMLESSMSLADTEEKRMGKETELYELEKQHIIDLMELEAEAAQKKEENEKKKRDAEAKSIAMLKQNLSSAAEMFKQTYEVGGEKIKAFFYLSKAASLAQATMNIAEGITGAMKTGNPMSQIQAGITAAMGAVQVAKILSTNLADGGIVPGISPHDRADDKNVNLTSGEFVHSVSAVKHYGTNVMSAINNKLIPKGLFAGLPQSPSPSRGFALAGGGMVSNASQSDSGNANNAQQATIVNIVDPRMVEQYLSSAEGQDAIVNVIANKAQTVKRALR